MWEIQRSTAQRLSSAQHPTATSLQCGCPPGRCERTAGRLYCTATAVAANVPRCADCVHVDAMVGVADGVFLSAAASKTSFVEAEYSTKQRHSTAFRPPHSDDDTIATATHGLVIMMWSGRDHCAATTARQPRRHTGGDF